MAVAVQPKLLCCCQDDIRCVRKEAERTGAENREMTTKMEELQLFNDTSDKELKKLRTTKQVSPPAYPIKNLTYK